MIQGAVSVMTLGLLAPVLLKYREQTPTTDSQYDQRKLNYELSINRSEEHAALDEKTLNRRYDFKMEFLSL